MANSSVRLPAVEPFELTDLTPPSAAGGGTDAALETELMADLGVLSQPYGRATAAAQSTTDPSAGRLNQGEPTVKNGGHLSRQISPSMLSSGARVFAPRFLPSS